MSMLSQCHRFLLHKKGNFTSNYSGLFVGQKVQRRDPVLTVSTQNQNFCFICSETYARPDFQEWLLILSIETSFKVTEPLHLIFALTGTSRNLANLSQAEHPILADTLSKHLNAGGSMLPIMA